MPEFKRPAGIFQDFLRRLCGPSAKPGKHSLRLPAGLQLQQPPDLLQRENVLRACFLALLTLDDDGLLRRFKGFQAKEILEFATPDERASGVSPEDLSQTSCKMQEAPSVFCDPDSKVTTHEGWLPHWQQGSKLYYITWRMNDSHAQSNLRQRQEKRSAFEAQYPKPWDDETWSEYHRHFSHRIETLLDAGYGSCALRDPDLSAIVENALRHFDGDRFMLGDYVVMPNHIHVLVQPLGEWKLDQILHSWKSFTSKEINKRLGTKGVFWRDESFDHIVRSAAQWRRFTRYIQENPVKAHLAPGSFRQGCGKRASGVSPESSTRASVISSDSSSSSPSPFGETPKALSQYHANGLRLWENDDLVPRPDDVFQERLYCVRWIETRIVEKTGKCRTTKRRPH